tara:strand:+ start:117 stop:1073 length:957 start_codon:yes stop_codon:yes gene_type:complete
MVTKLTEVKIRDIWPTEDKAFTPWLVENINLLNEDIGLNLRDPKNEKKLTTLYVDVVAEDDEGKVIIENQFSSSDHDHLGKLLTYLSNIEDTKKAIWIVENARTEHKKAVEWLNQNAGICNFYLIRVKVFKIENSPPAVRFDLISGPDASSREIGQVKKEDSERLIKRYKFWQLFLEKLNTKSELFINISPNKFSWIGARSGVKAIQYNCAVKQSEARVEIYIDGGKGDDELTKKINKEIFSEFFKNKDQIEKDFGSKLDWNEKPDSRASTITKITDVGGWRDEEKWQEVHDELIEYVVGFERAFSDHVKNIPKQVKF